MAFSILLFEKDAHLSKLVKYRLATIYKDAYIRQVDTENDDFNEHEFSENTHIFFNDKQFSYQMIEDYCKEMRFRYFYICPLFCTDANSSRTIDCRRLASIIDDSNNVPSGKSANIDLRLLKNQNSGSVHLLLPFAYINERESFIHDELIYLLDDSDVCVRLNLMSGTRIPSFFTTRLVTGSLTSLLKKAKDNSINGNDILQSLNPDALGFLTPGNPDNADDVFDFGVSALTNLINAARELTTSYNRTVNVLIVAEGFRFTELEALATLCDYLHVLLPGRMHEESTGYQEEISALSRSLPATSNLTVYYSEDYKTGTNYEAVKI